MFEDEPTRYRKKRGGKKPFVIESKYTGKIWGFWGDHDWHVWSGYKTEKARDMAFAAITRKQTFSNWIYRVGAR